MDFSWHLQRCPAYKLLSTVCIGLLVGVFIMYYNVRCPIAAANAGANSMEEPPSSLAWKLLPGLQSRRTKRWPDSNLPPTKHCGCAYVPNATSNSGGSQRDLDLWLYRTFFCEGPLCQDRRTYVEMGAMNGVMASNTLFFQRHLGWSGLLVEGHPLNAAQLMRSERANGHNVLVNEAVCAKPGAVMFSGSPNTGTAGVIRTMSSKYLKAWGKRFSVDTARRPRHEKVQTANYSVPCRPMSQLLQLAQLGHVDLFVLDVEGAELLVLQTIDWKKVTVGIFVIEMDDYDKTRDAAIAAFLKLHGYSRFTRRGINGIFVHQHFRAGERTTFCHVC